MAVWISDRRLFLDRDGRVVEEGNPAKATLLVRAGGSLPHDRAEQLGLVSDPPPPAASAATKAQAEIDPEPEKAKPAPANKARTKPQENK